MSPLCAWHVPLEHFGTIKTSEELILCAVLCLSIICLPVLNAEFFIVLSMASRVILRPRAWNILFHVDCPRSGDESGRGWGWRCHSWRGLIRYVSETWDVSLSPINRGGNPAHLDHRPKFLKSYYSLFQPFVITWPTIWGTGSRPLSQSLLQ